MLLPSAALPCCGRFILAVAGSVSRSSSMDRASDLDNHIGQESSSQGTRKKGGTNKGLKYQNVVGLSVHWNLDVVKPIGPHAKAFEHVLGVTTKQFLPLIMILG